MDHFTEFELDVRTRCVNTCREHQKVAHLPIREQNKALVRGILKRGSKQHPLCLDHGGLAPHHLRVATIFPKSKSYQATPRHSKGTVEKYRWSNLDAPRKLPPVEVWRSRGGAVELEPRRGVHVHRESPLLAVLQKHGARSGHQLININRI